MTQTRSMDGFRKITQKKSFCLPANWNGDLPFPGQKPPIGRNKKERSFSRQYPAGFDSGDTGMSGHIHLDLHLSGPIDTPPGGGTDNLRKMGFLPETHYSNGGQDLPERMERNGPPPRNGKPVKTGKRLFIPFPCAPFPTNCLRSKRGFSAAAGSRQQTHPTGPYRGFALRSHPSRESCPDGRIGSVPG